MSSDKRRTGAERMWRSRDRGSVDVIEGRAVEVDAEAVSLGARLSELLAEESPESLLLRLQTFQRSVEDALARSSSAFQILRQLESAGLKDCARCTAELEQRLAHNAHFQVLGKLAEAESLLKDLSAPRR